MTPSRPKTAQEKREIEKQRWQIEQKRKEMEEKRWPRDEKIKQINDKIQEIDYKYQEIDKKTTREMDEHYPFWRSTEGDTGEPTKYSLDFNTGYITIHPAPDYNYLLRLSVVRYPITAMTTTSMSTQTPVTDARYHDDIVNGLCSLALLKRGKETFDPQTGAVFKGLFDKAIMQIKIKNLRAESIPSTQGPHGGFI
jgi:hypothetical protein